MIRIWRLALLVPFLLTAAPVTEQIDILEHQNPAIARAYWGALAVELDTGHILYEKNSERLFVPASNTKLFTTALALARLGPDYRFQTRVLGAAKPDWNGVLEGDLVLLGGADPALSGRDFPYRNGPVNGDPLAPLASLAADVVNSGLKVVAGDVIGDDSAFVDVPYPPTWELADITWDYGAPVNALVIHDNSFRVKIRPGRNGSPAVISTEPPLDYYRIINRVKTASGAETNLNVEWPPGSRDIEIWGSIKPREPRDKLLAIRDPAHYAASLFADILRSQGVVVRGAVKTRHLPVREVPDLKQARAPFVPSGFELAQRSSPPLLDILKVTNKVSQNLHAELLLREVGRVRRNVGSREAGLEEMIVFLKEIGIREDEFQFQDGCGMSPQNLVTPAVIVRLLSYMYFSGNRDAWLDMLPVGGADGTLSSRFRGAGVLGRVLAKTGSMTHVSALSGYGERPGGGLVAFSIVVNNYDTSDAPVRRFIDAVVALLLDSPPV